MIRLPADAPGDSPLRPFDQLLIPEAFHAQLVDHARRTLPEECCGLLAGRIHRRQGIVTHLFPLTNALASPTAYQTDPRDLLQAFRMLRQLRCELLAFYHSHPRSPPCPSRRDLEQNTYGSSVVHIIVSLAGETPQIAAWYLFPDGYEAVPWHVVVTLTQSASCPLGERIGAQPVRPAAPASTPSDAPSTPDSG